MERLSDSETGCCIRFDPKPWENKEINFKNTLFIKDHVISFFHIPLNFGKIMVKNVNKIIEYKAQPKIPMCISDENSLWGADVYIAVKKNIPDSEIVSLPGTFLSKVFEGPFKNINKWNKEMKEYAKSKNKEIKKIYYFYTTCPKCAKFYGKNYVVLLAKIN